MKKLFLTLFLSAVTALATAQEAPAPKWLSKVQKSIVSVIAYDKDKKMIHEGVNGSRVRAGPRPHGVSPFKG